MGWEGQRRDLCLSARESRPHCRGCCQYCSLPRAHTHTHTHTHTHSLKNTYIKNKQPHTRRKTHTHAFNTGRPDCHRSTVCASSPLGRIRQKKKKYPDNTHNATTHVHTQTHKDAFCPAAQRACGAERTCWQVTRRSDCGELLIRRPSLRHRRADYAV